MSPSFASALQHAAERLRAAGVDTPRLDAEVLLMYLAGLDRTRLYLRLPELLAPDLQAGFADLFERRAAGEPVAYITASREFMGLDFYIDPRVLIPRPETEGLVERAITWVERQHRPPRIIDIGTGSGAIALSISRLSRTSGRALIVASDISRDALAVARINRERLGAGQVRFICGSQLDWARAPFDLIVANLPYLRDDQRHHGIALEPDSALYSGDLGFNHYAVLLRQSATLLAPSGLMLCEIDPAQHDIALDQARAVHPTATIRVESDLAGLDRYLIIERRPVVSSTTKNAVPGRERR